MPAATVDPLEVLLRGWGAWHQRNRTLDDDDQDHIDRSQATRSHAIALAREFAPGKRKRRFTDRGGKPLREMLGQALWAVDPIRCVETRTSKLETPHDVPAHVRRVETAVLRLALWDPLFARVVRLEYIGEGTQEDKARRAEMELRRYRDRLADARTWLRGRLDVV